MHHLLAKKTTNSVNSINRFWAVTFVRALLNAHFHIAKRTLVLLQTTAWLFDERHTDSFTIYKKNTVYAANYKRIKILPWHTITAQTNCKNEPRATKKKKRPNPIFCTHAAAVAEARHFSPYALFAATIRKTSKRIDQNQNYRKCETITKKIHMQSISFEHTHIKKNQHTSNEKRKKRKKEKKK